MKYAVESLINELLRKIEHQLTRIADALEEKNTTAENSDVHIIQVGSTELEQSNDGLSFNVPTKPNNSNSLDLIDIIHTKSYELIVLTEDVADMTVLKQKTKELHSEVLKLYRIN